jgi:hypothetical protein
LWESIYPNYSATEQAEKIKAKRKYGAGIYGPYYFLADEIYTPQVMSNAWSILVRARQQATADATSLARIEWLENGLKQTDLLLAAAKTFEHGIDSGDKTEFRAARQALIDFRKENANYERIHFAGLSGNESKWDREKR